MKALQRISMALPLVTAGLALVSLPLPAQQNGSGDCSAGRNTASVSEVQLTNVVVTRVWDTFFYVQQPDRSNATRVDSDPPLPIEGDLVEIVGEIVSGSCEPRVTARSVSVQGRLPVRPLGMRPRDLPGWDWVYNPMTKTWEWRQVGLIGFAMYTTIWGRVTEVDRDNGYVYVDDGARRRNFLQTHTGVRAELPPGAEIPDRGVFVVLWGICSCYPDETTSDPLPRILVRYPWDVMAVP